MVDGNIRQRKIDGNYILFAFFRSMEKLVPNGARSFFPINPDLADILGDTDFDFENLYFLDFFESPISRFPGPRFPNFQKSGLGPAWARLGPSLGPAWAQLGPGLGPSLGTAWARAWAQAWAQTPPPPAPDEFSDLNLTPLPMHPGIKYVARTLAAT